MELVVLDLCVFFLPMSARLLSKGHIDTLIYVDEKQELFLKFSTILQQNIHFVPKNTWKKFLRIL